MKRLSKLLFFQIFQILEHPLEEETLQMCKRRVITERESFVRFIFNDSWNSVLHRENIDRRLLDYEQTVARAANEGVNLVTKTVDYKWTYIQAVFFASTILTTIGQTFRHICTYGYCTFESGST